MNGTHASYPEWHPLHASVGCPRSTRLAKLWSRCRESDPGALVAPRRHRAHRIRRPHGVTWSKPARVAQRGRLHNLLFSLPAAYPRRYPSAHADDAWAPPPPPARGGGDRGAPRPRPPRRRGRRGAETATGAGAHGAVRAVDPAAAPPRPPHPAAAAAHGGHPPHLPAERPDYGRGAMARRQRDGHCPRRCWRGWGGGEGKLLPPWGGGTPPPPPAAPIRARAHGGVTRQRGAAIAGTRGGRTDRRGGAASRGMSSSRRR